MKAQKTLKATHALWILFIDTFYYAFYHKFGGKNLVADALSKQSELLITMIVELTSLILSTLNMKNEDFGDIWNKCLPKELARAFHIQEQFLFHGNQICIPRGSFQEHLIKEFHSRGLLI